MGCCALYGNKVQPERTELKAVQKFEGPTKDRECRDVIFLLLFIAFLGGLGYVIYRGLVYGNPNRLFYGTDSWGNVCNQKNAYIAGARYSGQDTTGLSELFYFKKNYEIAVSQGQPRSNQSITICIKECPNYTISTVSEMQAYSLVYESMLCVYGLTDDNYYDGEADGRGRCPPLPIEGSASVLHRCISASLKNTIKSVSQWGASFLNIFDKDFGEKCVSDLKHTWPQMAYISAAGLGIALVFLILLRFFAGILVWATVILIALGSIAGAGICWYMYGTKKTTGWLAGAIIVSIIALIILLILLVLRKRISLVVQLFKEAGKAIGAMPLLLLQPLLTFLLLAGAVAGLLYILLCLSTTQIPAVDQSTGYVNFQDDRTSKALIAYHVLAMLWITQFFIACERVTISGAVAEWYFTRDKSKLSWPISLSMKRLMRYHLGSVAFGSLIIAFVSFIRYILSFIEGRLKGAENAIAKFCLLCCGCCLWCFEKFLKFLNSNAYIEIAINGYSFCKAAYTALMIIVSNALRLAAINCVGDFLLFLIKIGNVAIIAFIGIEVFKNRAGIYYLWLPITIACIVTYFLTSVFMAVYEMSIDAIFICFCEDCDKNDGVDSPYFMSKGLMEFVKNSEEAKKAAKTRKKEEKEEKEEK